jgi:exosortase/archaeosortase family protein
LIKGIKDISATNKFILLFLLKAIGLYLLWYVIYDLWQKKVGDVDNWIVDSLVYFSVNILEAFDYMLYVDHHVLGIHGAGINVFIGPTCNGLELYALFAGFVLIFEGSWKHKLWFIPLGIIILYFFNVIRILALVFNGYYFEEWLQFNHKYTYTIVMYVITFIGWMIWVKKFSNQVSK